MKSDYQKTIITRLRNIRLEKRLSQLYVATELGISPGHLGNIESDRFPTKYTLEEIYNLCKIFNVPIEQVFLSDKDFDNGKDIINNLIFNIIKYERGR